MKCIRESVTCQLMILSKSRAVPDKSVLVKHGVSIAVLGVVVIPGIARDLNGAEESIMARQIQRIIQGAELKEFAEFYRFKIRYHEEIYTGFRC